MPFDRDHIYVTQGALSKVYLCDDIRFWWLILVPQIAHVTELFELSASQQIQIMTEITTWSRHLKAISGAEKINVGSLGNRVPQLHVHIVARSEGDACWPDPVWGTIGIKMDDAQRTWRHSKILSCHKHGVGKENV